MRQAYRAVPLAFLLACSAVQAEDRSADQVLLAPGKTITFSDSANPGINVVVTAPDDSYINLSRLVAASEKAGIYSIMTTVQIKAASSIVSNADGSLSLRPASSQSYFVPKDAAPAPGRITLEGGTALLDRGRVVIHSDRIVQPGVVTPVPGRPVPHATPQVPSVAARPAGTPVIASPVQLGGGPVAGTLMSGSASVTQPSGTSLQVIHQTTRTVASFSSFNVGNTGGVTVTAPSGGATLYRAQGGNITFTGTLSATGTNGNVVIINPGGTVTVGPNTVLPAGGLSISTTSTPMVPNSVTVTTTGGIKLPTPITVTPR